MLLRKRVVVYVEREDGLLVFDHRDHPEAGTQVPLSASSKTKSWLRLRSARFAKRLAFSSIQSRRSSGRTNISTDWANLPGVTSSG